MFHTIQEGQDEHLDLGLINHWPSWHWEDDEKIRQQEPIHAAVCLDLL